METLFENLLSNQTVADILVLGVAFILFFFFFRKELRHEIKANIEPVKSELKANIDSVKSELKAEIAPIKIALENHITDTNKKIDRLTDRIDKQGEQFNRLYELLLKDKNQQ